VAIVACGGSFGDRICSCCPERWAGESVGGAPRPLTVPGSISVGVVPVVQCFPVWFEVVWIWEGAVYFELRSFHCVERGSYYVLLEFFLCSVH
jgi:hypothetical protein